MLPRTPLPGHSCPAYHVRAKESGQECPQRPVRGKNPPDHQTIKQPANPKFISESGIFTREDMTRLGAMGVDAVLIGEALMRERDIEAKLRELIG